jgi:hypothetical protein
MVTPKAIAEGSATSIAASPPQKSPTEGLGSFIVIFLLLLFLISSSYSYNSHLECVYRLHRIKYESKVNKTQKYQRNETRGIRVKKTGEVFQKRVKRYVIKHFKA